MTGAIAAQDVLPHRAHPIFLTPNLHAVIAEYVIFSMRRLHDGEGEVERTSFCSGKVYAFDVMVPNLDSPRELEGFYVRE